MNENIYQFIIASVYHDEGIETISIHKTKKGAELALMECKAGKIREYKETFNERGIVSVSFEEFAGVYKVVETVLQD